MGLDYNVNRIMNDYNQRKKYQQKIELQQFQKKNCLNCKNKKTNKCEIRRDINGQLKCVYNEI
jgi:hypothetical protein